MNHAKKVWADGLEKNVYGTLLRKAAGRKEADQREQDCLDQYEAGKLQLHEFEKMLYKFGWARAENGFNAGVKWAKQQGKKK